MTDTLLILAVVLLAVAVMLMVAVLVAVRGKRDVTPQEVGASIAETWVKLGLGQQIGKIELHAEEIRRSHTTLEQMLRSPKGRGSFGELSLEMLLADHLPGDFYGIREKCFQGKIPDAHIRSTDGLICIDSKFPLDNFARMASVPDHHADRASHLKLFLRDADRHMKKVAEDYVRPDYGTAPFAFVYIPSEAVYYVLSTEGYDLLRRYVPLGVQVISPLVLAHKLELLKLGIRALRLNENAKEVLCSLQGLAVRFKAIDDAWQVFYGTHLRNLDRKANEIDEAYKRLHLEFSRIENNLAADLPSAVHHTNGEST